MVICVAALHGNEPAGILALRRVFRRIEDSMISLRGEFVGLAGNLPALAVGKRYLGRDLNRKWTWDRIGALTAGEIPDESVEDQEQRELLGEMRARARHATGDVFLLDLHTASAPTVPFVILGDTLRNREFARTIPATIVLGVEEQLEGTMLEYGTSRGHVCVGFEAGQHDDPASVDFHEAAIWLLLASAGAIDRDKVPGVDRFTRMLSSTRAGLPPVMEIFHRHGLEAGDGFVMRPGFRNFQKVERGTVLAEDRTGEIRAPGADRVFLPLYQGLGEDGFFLARPVNPVWLAVSSWMRRAGLRAIASRLPGISRHPERHDQLLVNRRVARLFSREFFHLLGYHVRMTDTDHFVAKRRRRD
jgi:succinylglutamate desuccinylase